MKKMKRVTTLSTAGWLLCFSLWFGISDTALASAIPPEGIQTTLSDAAYVNQEWMNYRFYITGYGIECSLGIGEMKDYPVNIHKVGEITICELKKTALIDAFITNINNALAANTTPVDSTVYQQEATSITMTGTSYYQLNAEARNWILGVLQQALMEKPGDIRMNLTDLYVTPAYSAQSLSLSPDFLLSGTCTTSFQTSGRNRSTNIEVASSHLNNMIIMPGQNVSVSNAILPRTASNGYKTAHAYLNGEIVNQTGGGICQVSSTVYNAARNSGMAVLERHPHSMPVSYLALGKDAAISSGTKDLVFQNPYPMPVVMQTSISNKKLTVNILVPASALNGTTYKFWSKKLSALSAESFITTYVDGVETSTVSVGISRYRALPTSEEN